MRRPVNPITLQPLAESRRDDPAAGLPAGKHAVVIRKVYQAVARIIRPPDNISGIRRVRPPAGLVGRDKPPYGKTPFGIKPIALEPSPRIAGRLAGNEPARMLGTVGVVVEPGIPLEHPSTRLGYRHRNRIGFRHEARKSKRRLVVLRSGIVIAHRIGIIRPSSNGGVDLPRRNRRRRIFLNRLLGSVSLDLVAHVEDFLGMGNGWTDPKDKAQPGGDRKAGRYESLFIHTRSESSRERQAI